MQTPQIRKLILHSGRERNEKKNKIIPRYFGLKTLKAVSGHSPFPGSLIRLYSVNVSDFINSLKLMKLTREH